MFLQKDVNGTIDLTPSGQDISLQWALNGLSAGAHYLRVHSIGDLITPNFGPIWSVAGQTVWSNLNMAAVAGQPTTGSYTDTFPSYNTSLNAFIGRTITVHGTASNSDEVAAACVIGTLTPVDYSDGAATVTGPSVEEASCAFTSATDASVQGVADFYLTEDKLLGVRLFVAGLAPGAHTFHVHRAGDLTGPGAAATLGHFIGNTTGFPANNSTRTEVGQLGDNMVIRANAKGVVSTSFVDRWAKLSGGVNSIVGRSLVIHGDGMSDAARVAKCVIGIKRETPSSTPAPAPAPGPGPAPPLVPQVVRASAYLTATSSLPSGEVSGFVDIISEGPDGSSSSSGSSGGVRLRYLISGLPPGPHGWHVHTYGDISSSSAMATAGHFIGVGGQSNAKPEVGLIANGTMIVANQDGIAQGEAFDRLIRLNGPNSVVGRAIVIHGDGRTAAPRVAQGAIGRTMELNAEPDRDAPPALQAVCYFTSVGSGVFPMPLGSMMFRATNRTASTVKVEYNLNGLAAGAHPVHVHRWGDLFTLDTAMATGPHFLGFNASRPVTPNEIGNLNNGIPLQFDASGAAVGSFDDDQIRLSGPNSIIGRSVVIHASVTNSTRVAQCVIGRADSTPGSEDTTPKILLFGVRSALSSAQLTSLLSDLAYALDVPSARLSFLSTTDATTLKLLVLPATAPYQHTASQVANDLSAQIATPDSPLYQLPSGALVNSLIPVVSDTAQLCADGSYQTWCPPIDSPTSKSIFAPGEKGFWGVLFTCLAILIFIVLFIVFYVRQWRQKRAEQQKFSEMIVV